jgi:hypothetical protein
MRRIGRTSLLALIAVRIGMSAAAQTARTGADKFEVVSIRKSMPESNVPPGGRGGSSGGSGFGSGCTGSPPEIDPSRIVLNNNSLYTLIAWA